MIRRCDSLGGGKGTCNGKGPAGRVPIIITIMVLELKHDATLDALMAVTPAFLSYALSFVSIYWNNHHHFFHLVRHVSGMMLWANMHLLFWLSLMGENHFAPGPNRHVWGWSADAGDRMIRAAASNHPHARRRIRAGAGDRSRPQEQGFAPNVRLHVCRLRSLRRAVKVLVPNDRTRGLDKPADALVECATGKVRSDRQSWGLAATCWIALYRGNDA
jgi:hypothetical protein